MLAERWDDVLLWLGRRFPSQARALDWRVYDRRIVRADRERAEVRAAYRERERAQARAEQRYRERRGR